MISFYNYFRAGFAMCVALFIAYCSWCSVAMAQTGDGGSAPQLRVRIFLEAPLGTAAAAPLAARVQHVDSVLRLMSRGAEATTQVKVVIDAMDTAADLRMTLSVDAAGAEVVVIPSEPIVVAAAGVAMRRSAEFALTAKKAGAATVTIAVADDINNVTVALRVIVEELPHTLVVIEPQANTELQLLSRGAEATTQVQVVIDATDTTAELRVTLSVDAAGAEVVAISSELIIIVAADDAMRRSAEFTLTAKTTGAAIVTMAVTDGASTATVALRVIVEELPYTLAMIEPQAGTELRLLSRGDEATTQVQVMIDATNTTAEIRMTVSVDAAGAEVVAISSELIIVVAADDAIRRSAEFTLTAKTTGTAIVTIAVTDGASTATVVLRVVVADLHILSPSDGIQIALIRGDGSLAATQVEVIIVQTNVEVPVVLDLQLERVAMPSVFISTTSMTLTASDNGSIRTQFTLVAAEAGNTTITLIASDSLGNRTVVAMRVSVVRVGELCESCLVSDMLTVSTGTFTMGSSVDELNRDADEEPQHPVRIDSAFAVAPYELTRGQYRAFVDASGYAAGSGLFSWQDPGFTQNDAHPVVGVSWNDANAYLSWLSEETGEEWRLLSEAEWEYVARAGTTTSYAFGNTINATQARFDSTTGTVAVGSYAANAFGLYDMHGNVREWVEDCWHNDYADAPPDGSAWLSDCDENTRVLRGGSHYVTPRYLRSANRYMNEARVRSIFIGFRVARTLKP